MTVIDTIYTDFKDAVKVLQDAEQISLQIMLEANLRKTLLLSAASYFESRLTREVQEFADEVTSGNPLVCSLVQQKAISRQYHSWFDWDKSNANKFFALFGPSFRDHMSSKISEDESVSVYIKAFLKIGNLRNLLVHSDYASYFIDLTPDEIYELYKLADLFVSMVGPELRSCSSVRYAHEPASGDDIVTT